MKIIFNVKLLLIGTLCSVIMPIKAADQTRRFYAELENIGIPFNEDPQLPLHATKESLATAKALLHQIKNVCSSFPANSYEWNYFNTLVVGQIGVIRWITLRLSDN